MLDAWWRVARSASGCCQMWNRYHPSRARVISVYSFGAGRGTSLICRCKWIVQRYVIRSRGQELRPPTTCRKLSYCAFFISHFIDRKSRRRRIPFFYKIQRGAAQLVHAGYSLRAASVGAGLWILRKANHCELFPEAISSLINF